MKKLLIAIDIQNDFVTGILGSPEAQFIIPKVIDKVKQYQQNKDIIVFTRDTHDDNFAKTQEGATLPIHCKIDTQGHEIIKELQDIIQKDKVISIDQTFQSIKALVSKDCQVLPVSHNAQNKHIFISNKCAFASLDFAQQMIDLVSTYPINQIELCGLCTDICVISIALVLKAALPELPITVDSQACAGSTPQKHQAALLVLESCQVKVK